MSSEEITDAGSDKSRLSTGEWNDLCGIMNGYVYSQVLATACELGLFTYLSRNPGATLEDVEAGLGLSAYSSRVLMLACCATRLINKDAIGKYFNSSLAGKVLVAGSGHSMIRFVEFNDKVQRRCMTHFSQALRETRNAGLNEFPGTGETLYARLTGYPELERLFQEAMGQYTRLSPSMLDMEEFSAVTNLLDVGGGDGSNAIRLCGQYPDLRVTVADIPSVAAIAADRVAKAGLASRIRCIALDMFHDPWPEGFDAVLLSHVVEIFTPDRIQFLYNRANGILPDCGRLFVWTLMANDVETEGLQAAKSSIYFLSVASGEGMTWPGSDHEKWLLGVGFSTVKRYDVRPIDHGGLVATKQRITT